MKTKLFAISVLMTAFFVVAPGAGFCQDDKGVEAKPDKNVTEYKIVRHDTLWDISKRFLKNPLKWPKLWKQNPYIKNPDLIYPGDIVKIFPDGSVEIVPQTAQQQQPTKQQEATQQPAQQAPQQQAAPSPDKLPTVVLAPQPKENVVVLEPPAGAKKETKEAAKEVAKEEQKPKGPALRTDELARKGFISRSELKVAGAIIEPVESESELYVTKGNRVLLSIKDRKALKKGDRYSIFVEKEKIYHPVTGSYMGHIIDKLGTLTVTDPGADGKAAVGVIDAAYMEIPFGARLMPFEEVPKEVVITSPGSEIKGFIIAAVDGRKELSQNNVVYIDKGSDDGVSAGNVFKIYRDRDNVEDPMGGDDLSVPRIDLGTMVVMDAGKNTSSCIIVRSRKVIKLGDKIDAAPAEKELSASSGGK